MLFYEILDSERL